MGAIDEYSVGKCLHSSPRCQIHAGIRECDGLEVALKTYFGKHALTHVERELAALRGAAGPAIVAALDLLCEPAGPTLVLERAPGVTLKEWVAASGSLSPGAFIAVALQLADALTSVHSARWIHSDVTPRTVIVDPETLQTRLVGFDQARMLGSSAGAERLDGSDELLGENLHYVSPEQTGRMDRGMDSRSDLYSLGATLYFSLTGQTPFSVDDPLALIHAHMARQPTPPQTLRPELPAMLSQIVLRLLHKSPEDRYQRASALRQDLLRCQEELERTGSIRSEFVLGTADAPYRPRFSKRLHGRQQEIEAILDGYRTAAAGETVVLLLQGAAGVGKSALIQELRPSLLRDHGYLASGKFDLYRREQPYLGIVEALRSLAQQLLMESDARLEAWRAALLDALGSGAGALVEQVPELELVLGKVPPATRLPPNDTRLRLGLLLQRLVQVLATGKHPLVFFLDDLQWSDAGSRELLSDLILDPTRRALLLVCAFRSGELASERTLHEFWETLRSRGASLRVLELAPLGEQACAEMLAEALGRSPADTVSLAQCVARKTGNAPLVIQQFVQLMQDQGLIHFRVGVGWSWDDAELAAADVPESAVELLAAKIARLPHATATVLELASCIGNTFDLDLLVELSDRPPAQVEPALFALCDEGLIAPAPRGFCFVHDRIREAAQALMSREERARLHGRAARLLLAQTAPDALDERIFEIADHLNEATPAGEEAVERVRVLEIQLAACRRALDAGAGATAWHYFVAGEAQLQLDMWSTHSALCIELFLKGADAAHQSERFDDASRCLERLLEQPLSLMQRVQVHSRQIRTSSVTQPRPATVDLTLRLLRSYGIRWPRNPSWLRTWYELLRADWCLRHDLDEMHLHPCAPQDIERIAPALLLATAGQSLSMTSHRLTLLAGVLAMRRYAAFGFIVSPSFALAAYAAYRLRFTGQHARSIRCMEAARVWNQRIPNPIYVPRTQIIGLAYVDAWMQPRQRLMEPLRRASEAAAEAGDFEYACLSDALRTAMMAVTGCRLSEYEKALGELRWSQWSYAMSVAHATALRVYSVLRTKTDLPQAVHEVSSAHAATRDLYLYMSIHIIAVHLLLGDSERAFEEAERVRDAMFRAQIGTHIVDFVFWRGWAAADLVRTARGPLRRAARKAFRQSLRALRAWARPGSDFVHMHQLLLAEHQRLRGNVRAALATYVKGATQAVAHGHRQHAALAHERRAALLLEHGRETEARASLREAIACYEDWGATVKVESLTARLCRDELTSRRGA